MAKAAKPLRRVRATRKPGLNAPFQLNAEGAALQRMHRKCVTAFEAFEAAAATEPEHDRDCNYSRATCQLRDKWRTEMKRVEKASDAAAARMLTKRMKGRASYAWADATTLMIASRHSASARTELTAALDLLAGDEI